MSGMERENKGRERSCRGWTEGDVCFVGERERGRGVGRYGFRNFSRSWRESGVPLGFLSWPETFAEVEAVMMILRYW